MTVCVWFLWQISEIVILFLISLLMFYVVDPLTTSTERAIKVNRTAAILLFYLLCLIVVGLGLWLVLPAVGSQFQTAYSLLTDETVQADIVARANELVARSPVEVPVEDFSGYISEYAALALSNIASFLINLFSLFSLSIIVPFILFFPLKDGTGMKKGIISLVPNRFFEMSLNLIDTVDRHLGAYIRGQMAVASSVGALSALGLWIVGVPYYFVIGMFAGLANLIPYLGPVAGAIPAMILSLVLFDDLTPLWGDPYQALWEPLTGIGITFVIVQLTDNIFISPLIVSRSTNLHPLAVIIAVVIGAQLFAWSVCCWPYP
jgi:putative permease